MRIKDKIDKYVVMRLEHWAEWYRKDCDHGLGFKRKSIFARLQKEGSTIINCTGVRPLPCDFSAEEIEALVVEISQRQYHIANALRTRYFNPLNHEHVAKRQGYSTWKYYSYLRLGHDAFKKYFEKNFRLY